MAIEDRILNGTKCTVCSLRCTICLYELASLPPSTTLPTTLLASQSTHGTILVDVERPKTLPRPPTDHTARSWGMQYIPRVRYEVQYEEYLNTINLLRAIFGQKIWDPGGVWQLLFS